MLKIPTVDFLGHKLSRLICGGNPLSGYSHVSAELDREMIDYYSTTNMHSLLTECWENGINTFQSRGDRHQMRFYLEHRQNGANMNWIAQTASEFADISANIAEIARYKPIAIYHHGTDTDNSWHDGKIDRIRDYLKMIHDHGLPAGIGTHIPEVIEYAEGKGWETDFYMCCFYNLARQHKNAPAVSKNPYANEEFVVEDPLKMTGVMRQTDKPCIGFKIMGAGRNCKTSRELEEAFVFAFGNIKSKDIINVGMFQKYKNQVRENALIASKILSKQMELQSQDGSISEEERDNITAET